MSTLRAILKYRAYRRILAIQNKCKSQIKFTFKEINLVIIEKDIYNLKINKASQFSDISTKIMMKSINNSIKFPSFLSCLKPADVTS